jgi:5-methylcytosine-specific restriction endonuclease McrA
VAAPPKDRLDDVVAQARRARELREQSYRGQALKLYPHVCGRCGRDFDRRNLHELTVHHRDHNHDNNPADGSNWELLCLFCHDNEHQRQLLAEPGSASAEANAATASHKPFADLLRLLQPKKD